MPILKIRTVVYGRGKDISDKPRRIAIIAGIPFYESTGDNSHHPKTWLPFIDIASTEITGTFNHHSATLVRTAFDHRNGIIKVVKNGYIHKMFQLLPDPVWPDFCKSILATSYAIEKLVKLKLTQRNIDIPAHIADELKQEIDSSVTWITQMFPCLQIMVISAALGGGFWNTLHGSILRDKLAREYDIDFAGLRRNIEFMPAENCYGDTEQDIAQLNSWLIDNGSLFTTQVYIHIQKINSRSTAKKQLLAHYTGEFTTLAQQISAIRKLDMFSFYKLPSIVTTKPVDTSALYFKGPYTTAHNADHSELYFENAYTTASSADYSEPISKTHQVATIRRQKLIRPKTKQQNLSSKGNGYNGENHSMTYKYAPLSQKESTPPTHEEVSPTQTTAAVIISTHAEISSKQIDGNTNKQFRPLKLLP